MVAVIFSACLSTSVESSLYLEHKSRGLRFDYPQGWRIISERGSGEIFSAADARGASLSVHSAVLASSFAEFVRLNTAVTQGDAAAIIAVEWDSPTKARISSNSSSVRELTLLEVALDCGQKAFVIRMGVFRPFYEEYSADFERIASSARCAEQV
ncbi:hypothetical protein HY546_02780 [archaeon]|nr:hypothetical protein [archaeon]